MAARASAWRVLILDSLRVLCFKSRRFGSGMQPCRASPKKMQSPRLLGSRLFFWLVAPWLGLGIVAVGLVAMGHFDDGKIYQGVLASAFVLGCALGLYAMISQKHGHAIGRIIAAMVPAAYLWYFADTFFVEGQSLQPTGRRSDASPFNAICGFVVFGVPCLIFAIKGRLFGEPENEAPIKPQGEAEQPPDD